jgi:hypothetical protein
MLLDYCRYWQTWRDEMVALKRSPVSFSSFFNYRCNNDTGKMYGDNIVSSILSALTSGPLVIQRQVKALHHLGSSSPSDSGPSDFQPLNLRSHQTYCYIVGYVVSTGFLFAVVYGILDPSSSTGIDEKGILPLTILLSLSVVVSLSILILLSICLFLAGLFAAGFLVFQLLFRPLVSCYYIYFD